MADTKYKNRITIIGGGLLGLSIAYFFQKSGYKDIIVIEKEERLGGACSWLEISGTLVDRFYHVITAEDGRIFRFMDELGIKDNYGFTTTRMGIFDGKKSHPINTAKEFLTYPNLSMLNKLKLAYTIIYCQFYKNWKRLESLSVPEWLTSVGGKENYETMWLPIMRAKFGDRVDKLTAVDMWARISRMSSSRKADFSQQMAYIKGTPKTLIDRLERHLIDNEVKISKDDGVKSLVSEKGKITGIEMEKGEFIESDVYIFTVPLPNFELLIPDEYAEYKNKLNQIQYLDNVCLILKLSKPLTPFYMLNIQDPRIPFTGVIGLSHIYPADEFDGYSVFYISRYLLENNDFFHKSKDEVLSLYMPHLERINPDFNESWIAGYELSKGKNIEPFHRINYSKYIPPRKTAFENCFLVTTAQIYPEATVLNASVNVAEDFVNTFRQI